MNWSKTVMALLVAFAFAAGATPIPPDGDLRVTALPGRLEVCPRIVTVSRPEGEKKRFNPRWRPWYDR